MFLIVCIVGNDVCPVVASRRDACGVVTPVPSALLAELVVCLVGVCAG